MEQFNIIFIVYYNVHIRIIRLFIKRISLIYSLNQTRNITLARNIWLPLWMYIKNVYWILFEMKHWNMNTIIVNDTRYENQNVKFLRPFINRSSLSVAIFLYIFLHLKCFFFIFLQTLRIPKFSFNIFRLCLKIPHNFLQQTRQVVDKIID